MPVDRDQGPVPPRLGRRQPGRAGRAGRRRVAVLVADVAVMDELRPRARTAGRSDLPSGARRPALDGRVAQLLLALRCRRSRFGAVDGEDRERLVVRGVRPHRLRQPAARRHDAPDHRRRRDRPDPARHRAGRRARGPSRAASSRSTRRSTRRRSARPARRPGCSSSRARSSASTRGSRRGRRRRGRIVVRGRAIVGRPTVAAPEPPRRRPRRCAMRLDRRPPSRGIAGWAGAIAVRQATDRHAWALPTTGRDGVARHPRPVELGVATPTASPASARP